MRHNSYLHFYSLLCVQLLNVNMSVDLAPKQARQCAPQPRAKLQKTQTSCRLGFLGKPLAGAQPSPWELVPPQPSRQLVQAHAQIVSVPELPTCQCCLCHTGSFGPQSLPSIPSILPGMGHSNYPPALAIMSQYLHGPVSSRHGRGRS